MKLSLRNAKRQFNEYALFFVTLTCAVASMYAFNALIFSDTVKALPDMELLPYLIVAASLLIILIMGWIISYMINYMLKRRSKEFSVYMVSGISNKKISTLIFFENSLIGLLAFVPGILLGMLLSQILEAVLLNMFGLPYTLHFSFSPSTVGLTLLYFSIMLLYSIRKNGKWIRRVQLRDMLYYDRQNEKAQVSGSISAILIFCLSILAVCAGFLFIYFQPLGKGYDILIGTIFLLLFLFGFFISVPAFLVARFGNRSDWKYKSHRLVPFRGFTAKVNSTSVVMGMLSILFMLAITFGGIGSTIGLMVTKNVEAGAFDIMILHQGELGDFSRYAAVIQQDYSAQGHTYGIYTDGETDFLSLHDQAVIEAGRPAHRAYAEFQYDTCMTQSDYLELRELLGYDRLELDPDLCYVHCVPALEKSVRTLIDQQDGLDCAGYPFADDGVFSEPFSQVSDYGNGAGYVIVVPDRAVGKMEIVYSVYAAVTEKSLSPSDLRDITDTFDGLAQLDRSSAKSTSSGAPTAFMHEDIDYLSGKWADKTEFHYLYSMLICLFYLALILEITGAAILATQVLSDWRTKQRQDRILRQLGMSEQLVSKLNNRQLSQIFLLPLIPSLILSICFVYICAKKILVVFFPLPIVPDILWIGQSLCIAWMLFALLYGIYYVAARISYGQRGR
jgi:ABC-type antimicrobial peptide transport system permease subunit